jgi:hypothetical protein
MTESARDEALRLLRESGFEQLADKDDDPMCSNPTEAWIGSTYRAERLIALARQPLLDVINEHLAIFREMFEAALPSISDGVLREKMRAWLAAAPKPEEGK